MDAEMGVGLESRLRLALFFIAAHKNRLAADYCQLAADLYSGLFFDERVVMMYGAQLCFSSDLYTYSPELHADVCTTCHSYYGDVVSGRLRNGCPTCHTSSRTTEVLLTLLNNYVDVSFDTIYMLYGDILRDNFNPRKQLQFNQVSRYLGE